MMVQTTLVHGASLPYFGPGSYRIDMFSSRTFLCSIGRAPLWRLCSIVLRSGGSEPLPDRSASAPFSDRARVAGLGVPSVPALRACHRLAPIRMASGFDWRRSHGGPLSGSAGLRTRAQGRKDLAALWRPSGVLRPSCQTARACARRRLGTQTGGRSHCKLPATLAMPALAQTSSFSPPGAPETPTAPITSLPTLIGTPPPTATTLGICFK